MEYVQVYHVPLVIKNKNCLKKNGSNNNQTNYFVIEAFISYQGPTPLNAHVIK